MKSKFFYLMVSLEINALTVFVLFWSAFYADRETNMLEEYLPTQEFLNIECNTLSIWNMFCEKLLRKKFKVIFFL